MYANTYNTESFYITTSIILLLYITLLVNFFLLLNVFDSRYIKTLSDLKKFGTLFPFNFLLLILVLSFAGVPPLIGFTLKLIVFKFLITTGSTAYIVLLILFNFFTLYFYVQNTRYLLSKSTNNYYIYVNHISYLSESSMFFASVFCVLNTIGLVCVTELYTLIASFLLI